MSIKSQGAMTDTSMDSEHTLISQKKYKGRVKLYFSKKSYGFIEPIDDISEVTDVSGDVFFHRLQLEHSDSQYITTGNLVSFTLQVGEDAKLKVGSFTLQNNNEPSRKWPKEIEVSEGKQLGTVKWFNHRKGFGFIEPKSGGEHIFVHQCNVTKKGFRSLRDGEDVEFKLIPDLFGNKMIAGQVSGPNGSDVQGSSRL